LIFYGDDNSEQTAPAQTYHAHRDDDASSADVDRRTDTHSGHRLHEPAPTPALRLSLALDRAASAETLLRAFSCRRGVRPSVRPSVRHTLQLYENGAN